MSDPIIRLNAVLAGRYHVERRLGEGGMATVYLAEDLKHERKIALKVLKPELAAAVGAERFLAEIKTTANLQHPHILPLFDSGEAGGFLFYVMPYVAGESLRERLDREHQIPVDDAVHIATKLAEALDHAHRHGVVHRDIKPANILMQDGQPVVSDFGIALAVGAAGGTRLTRTGLSVGTPYYMSPEQATGDQHVGTATDIYSLGCVLYEMLVGEPPYAGTTSQAILGRIITGQPDRVIERRPVVPRNVDAATWKALEKVPADRFASARELGAALANPAFRWPEPVARRRTPISNPFVVGATALAFALGIALGRTLLRGPGTPPALPARVTSILFPDGIHATPRNFDGALAVTDDGTRIVYVAAGADHFGPVRMRALGELQSDAPVAGTDGAASFFLSADGQSIGFYHPLDRSMKRVPTTGGQAVTIAQLDLSDDRDWFGATWGPDQTIVYATRGAGLQRVTASGGRPEKITTPEQQPIVWHRQPRFLPDGSGIVFTATEGSASGSTRDRISILRFGDHGEVVTLTDGHSPRITADGILIFSRGSTGDLWAARLTRDWTRLSTPPARVLESGPIVTGLVGFVARYDVADDGTLIYQGPRTAGGLPDQALAWVDRRGNREEILDFSALPGATGGIGGPRLSPDGSKIAFRAFAETPPQFRLFVWDLDRDGFITIPADANADWPVWLDDERLIFNRFTADETNLYWTRADGTAAPQPWGDPNSMMQHVQQVSPDGKYLVIQERAGAETPNADIRVWPLNAAEEGRTIISGPSADVQASVDPTGKWLAYATNRSGQFEVYVTEFPDARTRIRVSSGSGSSPVWGPSGEELFYRRGGAIWALSVVREPEFHVEREELLFEGPFADCCAGGGHARTFDINRDGQRFLMVEISRSDTAAGDTSRIELFQGWLDLARRQLGGG